MSHTFKRARSRRAVWLSLPLVALVGIALALLVPTLGSARSQAKPVNKKEPQISGVAVQGETLTATTGKWQNNPTSFAFQWLRCPSNGGNGNGSNCPAITGATTNSLLLASTDVGFTIRVRVTATNADGSGVAASNATAIVAAGGVPKSTSPPTISGTPQVGQTLTANKGTWAGTQPISYSYSWRRCDKNGGSCSVISGATNPTYTIPSIDAGATLRIRVTATNARGSTSATSVPTAVITTAPPPSAPGCPTGSGPIQVTAVTPPARLLIDQQQARPSVIHRGAQTIILRYHVSACGGRSVQGALVYATAVPFAQLSIPGEQPTGSNGFAELSFRTLAGFPASQHQQLLAIFVRARKSGEDLLGGISTRRLFSVPVSLR
jgi:hypothetical protein